MLKHLACLANEHPLAISSENVLIFLFHSGSEVSAHPFTLWGRGGRALLLSPLKGLNQRPGRLGMILAGH